MRTLTMADIMTTELVTIESDMSLLDVAAVLSERHIGGAPVLERNRVVGVVSAVDLLRYAATAGPSPTESHAADGELAEALLTWTEEDDSPADFYTRLQLDCVDELEVLSGRRDILERATAGDVMTRPLCSLPTDASVLDAANYMLWGEIHRLLIIDGEELVGIVTAMDIVRAVAQRKL